MKWIFLLIPTLLFSQFNPIFYSHKKAIDSDASAFMLATGIPNDATIYYASTPQEITGKAMWTAVNNLVISLKMSGIWIKVKAFYPMVGGNSTSHKLNLKDPRDLDIAFRLLFVNSPTHSSLGMQPNGTSSYAISYVNPSTTFSNPAICMGYYGNTLTTIGTSDRHAIGCYVSTSSFFSIGPIPAGTTILTHFNYSGNVANQQLLPSNTGFTSGNSTTTTMKLTVRTTTSAGVTVGGTAPNLNIWIGALNLNNTYYQGVNIIFSSVHITEGLTGTELSNLNTIINSYQTALFRNVI